MLDDNPSSWKFWTQRRHIFTMMAWLGFFNIYSLRVNLSIAIVAMTSATNKNGTADYLDPEFSWDNKIQGYLLSSFFYGYITTQLLGGVLSKKFGGKWIFGGGIASTAFLTLISPWLAEWSVYALLGNRILMGIFEGITYASIYSLYTKWIPIQERSRVPGQALSGCHIGAVFAMMFLAYLAKVAGWRSIFWVSGGLGLIWFILWSVFISESPETDPRISAAELRYIQQSLTEAKSPETISPIRSIKWKNIASSKAAWALNVATACESWGFYSLLTLLPKYFKDIYGFDISQSGILSALPYLALAMMVQVTGITSNRISMKNWLSVTQLRKIFVAVGFLAQTSFMLGATFWGDVPGTVFCLTMAIGLGSTAVTALSVNPLDIAPLNCSIVNGISNTFGTISGIISPIIAGYLISTTNPTVYQWRIVFYIAAGLYLFGAIFFILFGSGTRESWDFPESAKLSDDSDRNCSTKIKQINQ